MLRNSLFRLVGISLLLVCSVSVLAADGQSRQKPSRQPNIVLLLADDLGYGELGCQGNPQIPTPHIDSLAKTGVRFTAGYVTAPYCSASRAGLLTGRYQTRFGYEFNPVGAHNEDPNAGLPASERTLAQHLRDAGYTTGLVGKWHLGGHATYHPLRRGFDEFFGFLHEGHYYVPPPYNGVTTMLRRKRLPGGKRGRWISRDGTTVYSTHMGTNEPAYDADNPILRNGQPVRETDYLTDAFTREAVDFIDRNQDRPFFLYVAYNAVHSPLQGAQKYMRKFAHIEDIHRRIFAAMLANLDDSVGTVLAKLRREKLDRHTLVIFLSDNGGPTRELTSSNHPLRGGKGDVYEGGIRIPFLMRWTGRLPAGTVYRKPVLSLDIFATAAVISGKPLPKNHSLDGVHLLPFLTGEPGASATGAHRPHETLFWRLGKRTAVRYGDWKLLRNPRGGNNPGWQLYNLSQDTGEKRNLIQQNPAKYKELMARWKQLNAEMKDPRWKPGR